MMSQMLRKGISHCLKANQRIFGQISFTQYAISRTAQQSSQCIDNKSHFSTIPGESSTSQDAESSVDQDSKASRYTNSSPRFETTMTIAQNKAGLLIGQAGVVIRQLMQTTGCGIHVGQEEDETLRVVQISSEVESRLAYAKELIHEIVTKQGESLFQHGFDTDQEYKLECHIPKSKMGMLVGKGGDNINRIRGLTNCNIQAEPAEEGTAKVKVTFSSGKVLNCFRARDSALAFLNMTRESLHCEEHVMSVSIPGSFAGELVGKGGATIRTLQQLAKTEIRLASGERGAVESEVVIRGVERDCEDARDIVTALTSIHKRHNQSTSAEK